jgi:hypothetical protein
LLTVVAVANFAADNRRSETKQWPDLVHEAAVACQSEPANYPAWGASWWRVNIPCDRVR